MYARNQAVPLQNVVGYRMGWRGGRAGAESFECLLGIDEIVVDSRKWERKEWRLIEKWVLNE